MNDIALRTDKGEYEGKDFIDLYVYINAASPIPVHGVTVSFTRVDWCPRCDKVEEVITEAGKQFSGGVLKLGAHRFPFSLQVPTGLPASTSYDVTQCSNNGTQGQYVTGYYVTASVVGAVNWTARRSVVLREPCETTPRQIKTATLKVGTIMKETTQLQLGVSVGAGRHVSGENMKVHVDWTPTSLRYQQACCVKSIYFKFSRVTCFADGPHEGDTESRSHQACTSSVAWERKVDIVSTLGSKLNLCYVPLYDVHQAPVPASSGSSHAKCDYSLEVGFTLHDDRVVSFSLPVRVAPRPNTEWMTQQLPDWCCDAT